MKIFKKIIYFGMIFFGMSVLFIFWANHKIESEAKDFVTYDIQKLPNEKVGLLLGTGKFLSNGKENAYFFYRIDVTEKLYKTGKIKNVLISGDNSQKDYSEPEDMQAELIKRGIPKEHIYLDFAGFRTLDSVVRAKEIFGQNSFIIISQKFHNERAIFLAQHYGIKAYGFNAKDVNKYFGFKTKIREYFARVKVFVDFLLGVEPKFGGEKVEIK
jgi:SanA protein